MTESNRECAVLDLREYGPGDAVPTMVFDLIEGRSYLKYEGEPSEPEDRLGGRGRERDASR
jgi:hypothetical protein